MFKKVKSVLTCLFMLTVSGYLSGCNDDDPSAPSIDNTQISLDTGQLGDGNLQQHVENIRKAYKMPALAAFMLKDGEVAELVFAGHKVDGQPALADEKDRWVIGSFTKSMTATLAARLVEQGIVTYEHTVADIWPELVGAIQKEHESISLKQLLTMTSGLKREEDTDYQRWNRNFAPLTEQRRDYVTSILKTSAHNARGEFHYSNSGYIVAAHMLETITSMPWEKLISQEVFEPLGITNFGFGPPNIQDTEHQLSGHLYSGGNWQQVTTMQQAFLPLVISPAGLVNIGMPELATYVQAHMDGMRGESNILNSDSYDTLHSPVITTDAMHAGYADKYAHGWFYSSLNNHYKHGGGTASFTVENLLIPEENVAFLAITNNAASTAILALEETINLMRSRYAKSK